MRAASRWIWSHGSPARRPSLLNAITHWLNGPQAGTTMLVLRMAFFGAFVGAALWLIWRLRRIWKAQRASKDRSCACLTGCDGCPFAGKSCAAGKKT